jgi:hypothetical protein
MRNELAAVAAFSMFSIGDNVSISANGRPNLEKLAQTMSMQVPTPTPSTSPMRMVVPFWASTWASASLATASEGQGGSAGLS